MKNHETDVNSSLCCREMVNFVSGKFGLEYFVESESILGFKEQNSQISRLFNVQVAQLSFWGTVT
jgi:hypothetical protein